jgi:hypothetical protein
MPVLETALRNQTDLRTRAYRFAVPFIIVAFSAYYFIDVLVRASEKYFWFDEIVTLNVCRFSSIPAMWNALRHGVDFNPLLFFVVTNVSTALFGDNLIGPRMPEIIAFWVMCLCLFRFVNRRAGPVAGMIAMALPTISGAFYYAYEARPHGLVLGFCGLALVCWQMAIEEPRDRRRLLAFSFSILGASLMHCYALLIAVPFAVVEIVNFFRFRRIHWPMWIALAVPALIACISYIPLLRSYRVITKGTDWSQSYMTNLGHLAKFYGFLLFPCILFLMWSFAALAADRIVAARTGARQIRQEHPAHRSEVILGVSFVALPVFGFIVSKTIVHGLFIDRYFASTVIGLCILLGLAAGAPKALDWMAITLAILLAFPVTWNFGALLYHRYRGVPENLIEPSSSFTMNVSLKGPLGKYEKFLPKDSGPIGILRFNDFLYLLHYAPELRQRIYYVKESTHDFFDVGFENFHPWSAFKYNHGITPREFVRLAPQSYAIGDTDSLTQLSNLVQEGGTVQQMIFKDDHFMVSLRTR